MENYAFCDIGQPVWFDFIYISTLVLRQRAINQLLEMTWRDSARFLKQPIAIAI